MLRLNLILGFLLFSTSAFAISEKNFASEYAKKVVPFLAQGERYEVPTDDGLLLSAIRFNHPDPVGTILVVNGQGETWLKFTEVFYDLYQFGYSVYSYDHRGQGLSPRLILRNSQTGYVDHFEDYANDLSAVVKTLPSHTPLFLLAHSMGGAVTAEYLEQEKSPFQAIVMSAPMFQINTKPYPEPIAISIVALADRLGLGTHYAIGQKDWDPSETFEQNKLTKSPVRFDFKRELNLHHPETVIGGASSHWVYESIRATHRVRRKAANVSQPILLFQAGADQIVKLPGQNRFCDLAPNCDLVQFKQSQHEILMERDFIRNAALEQADQFFRNHLSH